MSLYSDTSYGISELITRKYSTSFYIATRLLDRKTMMAISAIYGFVRLADEIVDTFHEFNQKLLLDKFEADYYESLENGISLNPVLNSFQLVVRKYNIPDEHIQAFLKSMRYDLSIKEYKTSQEINDYIYGSADVVGLMCLKVFCNGNDSLYIELVNPAMKLGSAFQKVNFLRDLKDDAEKLNRNYFPDVDIKLFSEDVKQKLVDDINKDFDEAWQGIKKLPGRSKLAVLIAYTYYKGLLKRLKRTPASEIVKNRIRISNEKKLLLLAKAALQYKLNLI